MAFPKHRLAKRSLMHKMLRWEAQMKIATFLVDDISKVDESKDLEEATSANKLAMQYLIDITNFVHAENGFNYREKIAVIQKIGRCWAKFHTVSGKLWALSTIVWENDLDERLASLNSDLDRIVTKDMDKSPDGKTQGKQNEKSGAGQESAEIKVSSCDLGGSDPSESVNGS